MQKISIAPMIDKTHRHFRYLLRLLSKHTLLYTEMISDLAILKGDRSRILEYSEEENPLAFQIGTSDIKTLKEALKIINDYNYCEINLNCGCPSDRVKHRNIGAILFDDPKLIKELLYTIKENTDKKVTLKTRLGIKGFGIDKTEYKDLYNLMLSLNSLKIDKITLHSRIALLEGLSPKENREIPPLNYDYVYGIKEAFSENFIEINGNIKTYLNIDKHLNKVDAVMLGRVSYEDTYIVSEFDNRYFACNYEIINREEILFKYIDYVAKMEDLHSKGLLLNPVLNLFKKEKNNKTFKSFISNNINKFKPSSLLEKAYKNFKKN